jgi:hypothetical protein
MADEPSLALSSYSCGFHHLMKTPISLTNTTFPHFLRVISDKARTLLFGLKTQGFVHRFSPSNFIREKIKKFLHAIFG